MTLKDEVVLYRETQKLIAKFFMNNETKIKAWWITKNPLLGGRTPLELVEAGRIHKLSKVVRVALEGNWP